MLQTGVRCRVDGLIQQCPNHLLAAGGHEIDQQALIERNKVAFPFVCMTQVLYNLHHIVEHVPMSFADGRESTQS